MTSTAQIATLAFGALEPRPGARAGAEPLSKGLPGREAFQARDLLLRAAAFLVLTTASTILLALPYLGNGPDAFEAHAAPSARLEQAFKAATASPAEAELAEALSAAARKADRLTSGPDCGTQTWPNIQPHCLGATGQPAPTTAVRTVTVEYRTGESASALVRLPVQQLASQP